MIRPPMATVGIWMKAAMKEAHTDTSKIRPLDIPDLPLGTHAFDPESDNLIEGVTKVEISSSHAKSKFQEYQDEQGHHDEVYTDGSQDQHWAPTYVSYNESSVETEWQGHPCEILLDPQPLWDWGKLLTS